MIHRSMFRCAIAMLVFVAAQHAWAAFNLTFTISTPNNFTPAQREVLDAALLKAEKLWERVITGYQPGIGRTGFNITVDEFSGFAEGGPTSSTIQGGYRITTAGRLGVSPSEVLDKFASWTGVPGPANPPPEYLGLNYVDEILAHEIGHILGVGTQWTFNNVYVFDSYQYTGFHGVRAYRHEFDPLANFVPVENAGSLGTMNSHWNQRMRSSTQEGNPPPLDPWVLDPRVGIVGPNGRDFSSELMTGALDPDYGEPYLSLTTIQSLRDIGFTVVPEPATLGMLVVASGILLGRRSRTTR